MIHYILKIFSERSKNTVYIVVGIHLVIRIFFVIFYIFIKILPINPYFIDIPDNFFSKPILAQSKTYEKLHFLTPDINILYS